MWVGHYPDKTHLIAKRPVIAGSSSFGSWVNVTTAVGHQGATPSPHRPIIDHRGTAGS
jgi:hypothetical protein